MKKMTGGAARTMTAATALLGLVFAPAARGDAAAEGTLPDRGIFPELGAGVRIALPARLERGSLRATFDRKLGLLVLFEGNRALKAFATGKPAADQHPGQALTLAALLPGLVPGDAVELRTHVPADLPVLDARDPSAPHAPDTDGDGIPDRLDVLLGARKLVANKATYTEGYYRLSYPGGDVPRDIGVCTDTIVRAFRNAGFDLQKLVAEDIRHTREAYPLIKRPDSNIDHRRVRNLARWFERHVRRVPASEPMQAGDVVFLDTFPRRSGPDHVGIISDRIGPSGLPLVINNWTEGTVEGEMDLLPSVPVTHRFRLP
jgi:uncharacterized protein YijF (DUF1287 family)